MRHENTIEGGRCFSATGFLDEMSDNVHKRSPTCTPATLNTSDSLADSTVLYDRVTQHGSLPFVQHCSLYTLTVH